MSTNDKAIEDIKEEARKTAEAIFVMAFQMGALWTKLLPHPVLLNDERFRKSCGEGYFKTFWEDTQRQSTRADEKAAKAAEQLIADVMKGQTGK